MGVCKIPLKDYYEPTDIKIQLEERNGEKLESSLNLTICTSTFVKFKLEVVDVRNLDIKTDISWPDPYVVVREGNSQLFKTKTHVNERSCLFYEQLKVDTFSLRESLIFEVWDYNILTKDKLIGLLEVPIRSLFLKDGVRTEKSYPINHGLNQTLTFAITPDGFSLDKEENLQKQEIFEKKLKQKVEQRYQKDIEFRRKNQYVSKYYLELQNALNISNFNERMNKLIKIYEEVDHKEKGRVQKRRRPNEEATIQFVTDLVIITSKGYLDIGEIDKAKELLHRAELDFPSHQISHFLDELILKDKKDYYYIGYYKIHLPQPYKGDYLSIDRLPIVAMFFSWVVYEQRPRWMFDRLFDASVDKRLTNLGKWRVKNEIDVESYFINFHCIFAVSEDYGTVVCAVRGTENDEKRSLEDLIGWVTDFDITFENYPLVNGAKIHKGYLQQYLSAKFEVLTQIGEYLNNGYNLVLTGHSQGAGIAGIITLECVFKFPQFMKNIFHYTFGEPKIGNEIFANYMNSKYREIIRFYTIYKNDKDIVTTVPPKILEYHHYGKEHAIKANPKYYGNPHKIPGIEYEYTVIKGLNSLMEHGQEVYMDGLIDEMDNK